MKSALKASVALQFITLMAEIISLDGNGKSKDEKPSGLSARSSSCSLVIVSTLDGKLSALDTRDNGKLLWSLPAFHGPLLSSSLSSVQMAKHVGLIPSLDGGLYQVSGDKVEPIPFTADTLLGSFLKLPDGSILVGGKEATSCGLNPYSGKVQYVCSADGCQLKESDEQHVHGKDVLVLKRTQQTIRAVDQRTGIERWNFSVGQHDVSFLEAVLNEEDDAHCSAEDAEVFTEWNLRVSIPNGVVAAVNTLDATETEVVLWSHQFDSPIAAVWRLNGGFVQPVKLFTKEVTPELAHSSDQVAFPQGPVMYIGKHEGQVYIQTSEPFNPAQENVVARIDDVSGKAVAQRFRKVTWRPYLTSSPSRTPTVVTKELAVWNPLEYPFDNGYYLLGEVMPVVPPHTQDKQLLSVDSEDVFDRKSKNSSEKALNRNDLSGWWYGALFVTAAVAVMVQFILHFFPGSKKRNPEAITQDQKLSSATLTPSPHSSTASMETIKEPSTPTTPDSLSQTNSFVSRYVTDFEHELCLGKGGFGLVFQAKNKMDECNYAVKRISLPNCDAAREKVKREVKALAKLEHPSIVRYYNSWFEEPPVGWQDDFDAQMLAEGEFSELPSEAPSIGSGIAMHALPNDALYLQNGISEEKKARRRKKTNSCSRSRHSSYHSNPDEDNGKINGEIIDIHQLENEAFLDRNEISDSFSIEFASSSNKELTVPKNGFYRNALEESSSHGIIFRHSDSGLSQNKDVNIGNIGSLSSSDSTQDSMSKETSSSEELWLTSSHHSLLSREKHNCQDEQCNADKLSAPLYLYIQMQLCQQESLKDWLKANHERDHGYCLNVFEEILGAVEHFHGKGLMHRDLKPSNIFFSLDGSVKVGDFGLVTAHTSENNLDTPIKDSLMDDTNHTSQVGTQLYMSPEQMEGKAYSHKVDIFSLGLIFFELFCPFGTQMERIKVMCGVKQRVIPGDFKKKMPLQSELVQWLLSATPKARPNTTEVKNSSILRRIRQQVSESPNS
ncbi:hypothetical protein pdam_00015021 [Pocillopora damicornis]|uniref:non-specific serine/threonine protein kinase n=1 Tax=Pocillopora damicornis TaxID=46731 RepID=A0A3M6TRW0_POCDA|nr:eukaryotic translation initiation factor 2-alpha kinase 3-like [Pocillopora damicornis]RMX44076.1 hypothetical protein pdam_00015021 [Pocillopora damicornis]